uniref:Uncharacterized protein n=1 Tax=Anguilla anguilla TaxID=7936 RepID=A0A0E9Q1X6_ANGAN
MEMTCWCFAYLQQKNDLFQEMLHFIFKLDLDISLQIKEQKLTY